MFNLMNVKTILIGLSAIAVSIFTFLFNRRGNIIEDQKKELNTKDQEIKTSLEVNKSETSKTKLNEDIKDTVNKIEKETIINSNDNISKINNTKDNEAYEIKL